MPTSPGHQPIEPDTQNPKDPIHHPHMANGRVSAKANNKKAVDK